MADVMESFNYIPTNSAHHSHYFQHFNNNNNNTNQTNSNTNWNYFKRKQRDSVDNSSEEIIKKSRVDITDQPSLTTPTLSPQSRRPIRKVEVLDGSVGIDDESQFKPLKKTKPQHYTADYKPAFNTAIIPVSHQHSLPYEPRIEIPVPFPPSWSTEGGALIPYHNPIRPIGKPTIEEVEEEVSNNTTESMVLD